MNKHGKPKRIVRGASPVFESKQTLRKDDALEETAGLLHRIAKQWRIRGHQVLVEQRLTFAQFYILLFLSEREQAKMHDLKECVGASAPVATTVTDHLLKKGLIVRSRGNEDRRNVVVKITPRGMKVIDAINQERKEFLDAFLGNMSRNERAIVNRALKIMESSLDKLKSNSVLSAPVRNNE